MISRIQSLSIIIPAFNATDTIEATLSSIYDERERYEGSLEAIVVDDGSEDGDRLEAIVGKYSGVILIRHSENRGMCAARNTGLFASTGDIAAILDADDQLTRGWPEALAAITADWPPNVGVCWAACINSAGVPTSLDPTFTGYLSARDLLRERHAGEYFPMFRGDYIRVRGFVDLGTRRSCGLLSYLTFAQDGPFWVSSRVLRIYNDRRAGSITAEWGRPDRARESVLCLQKVLAAFGEAYRTTDRRIYGGKHLRLAIYQRLAGLQGYWRSFGKGLSHASVVEACGALLILILGRRFCVTAVNVAKFLGAIKRYG